MRTTEGTIPHQPRARRFEWGGGGGDAGKRKQRNNNIVFVPSFLVPTLAPSSSASRLKCFPGCGSGGVLTSAAATIDAVVNSCMRQRVTPMEANCRQVYSLESTCYVVQTLSIPVNGTKQADTISVTRTGGNGATRLSIDITKASWL